jgi:hypothetical protein
MNPILARPIKGLQVKHNIHGTERRKEVKVNLKTLTSKRRKNYISYILLVHLSTFLGYFYIHEEKT